MNYKWNYNNIFLKKGNYLKTQHKILKDKMIELKIHKVIQSMAQKLTIQKKCQSKSSYNSQLNK